MKTMKRIKLCLIAVFAIVFASMSCAFVMTSVKVAKAADTEETFVMDDTGLTLRLTNGAGLRFKVKMSENLGNRITNDEVTLNFLVAPRAVFDAVSGNYDKLVTAAGNAAGEKSAPARIAKADKGTLYQKDGYYWANVVIANVQESNRTLDMSAIAYYTENDVNTFATINIENVRGNLYNVVESTALSNAEQAKGILGNSEFSWYGTGNYPINIKTNAQAEVIKTAAADNVSFKDKIVLAKNDVTIPDEIAESVKTVEERDVGGDREEIVLGSDTDYTVDMGALDGNVVKATIGGKVVSYANGKVTLNADFKKRLQKHGEQTLTVTVEKDGAYTNYNKEILIVTKEIKSLDDLKAAVALDSNYVKYGFYRLTSDINTTEWINYGNTSKWNNNGDYGFRGTFDGNGKTISAVFFSTGLFGTIGNGAVIKNITLTQNEYVGGRMILGYSMVGAKLENVKINVKGKGTTAIPTTISEGKTVGVAGGLLTAIFAHSNDFENVVVEAKDTDVDTLFGSCVYYGYPTGYEANRFTNCDVIAKSIIGLACTDNAEGIKGNTSAFILSAENLSVGKISGTPWFDAVYIVWSQNQNTYDVDLKSKYVDYTNATVFSATWGEEAVTYENGKLTFPDEIISNKQKHGSKTLSVILKQGGKYYDARITVTVVTQEIKTVDELKAVSSKIYGYYRLANDLLNTGDSINVPGTGDWKNLDGQSGFRGTFDGNGKTISGWTRINGMFGIVGAGAVIKNFTYNVTAHASGGNVIARSITDANIMDITINITSIDGTSDANKEGGVITGLMSQNTQYTKVVINAAGLDLDTLFGFSYGWYKKENRFSECSVTAKSLAGLVNSGGVISATGIKGLTVTTEE